MNSQIKEFWDLNRMYVGLRDSLMEELTDEELAYTPGGDNPTLGALCRELGETQYAYAQSYKTFKTDFSYRTQRGHVSEERGRAQGMVRASLTKTWKPRWKPSPMKMSLKNKWTAAAIKCASAHQPRYPARGDADLLWQGQRLSQSDGEAAE